MVTARFTIAAFVAAALLGACSGAITRSDPSTPLADSEFAALSMDPARRDWVEERLDAIQSIARKHRIDAGDIPALHERLRNELDELTHAEERGQQLQEAVDSARDNFQILAEALSADRGRAADRFSIAVSEAMDSLGMPGGKFLVGLTRLETDAARPWGIDNVDFLISANPGQKPQPLARVASGGELSRMSLAIQVIASNCSSTAGRRRLS